MDTIAESLSVQISKKPKICQQLIMTTIQQLKEINNEDRLIEDSSMWRFIPEPVLLTIFWLLPIKDILSAGRTCRRWYMIANDELLWKQKMQIHFKTNAGIALKPGWYSYSIYLY